MKCAGCRVRELDARWAETGGRFTPMMERFAIAALEDCQTVKGAAALAGVSWPSAMGVMQRAGRARSGAARRGGSQAHRRRRDSGQEGASLRHIDDTVPELRFAKPMIG